MQNSENMTVMSISDAMEGLVSENANEEVLGAESDELVIVVPGDLSTLSAEDLTTLRANVAEALAVVNAAESVDFDLLGQLAAAGASLAAEAASREALSAESAEDEGDELAADEDADVEDDEDAEDDEVEAEADAEVEAAVETEELASADAEDEVTEVEAEVELAVETEIDAAAEVEDVVEVEASAEAEVVEEDGEALVAAATTFSASAPISVRRIRSRQTPENEVETPVSSPFRASVNVPGLVPGTELSVDQVAEAFLGMQDRVGKGAASYAQRGQRFSQRHEIASIQRNHTFSISDTNNATEILRAAADETRLSGGSLVAAGGWCAPSETWYDLCQLESTDGLYSLPTTAVTRGGVRFTQGPDWADIFANTGFCFTEADDIAGNYDGASSGTSVKPTDIVPCPDFTDVRLDVCGVTIQAGNLMNRAYPELVRRYVSGALTAHAHRVATNVLADVISQSTAISPTQFATPTEYAAAAPVLSAIELQAEDIKYRYRMSRNATLEAVFPFWARGVIRADLSRRAGVDLLSVTDAQIDGWFRARGISPQFIYNFDNLGTSGSGALVWPSTLRFLIYPAGTFVKGESPLITIEMLHDSTLNENNNFTAIFTEEGWSVMKMCPISRIVTVPVCTGGNTGTGQVLDCA